MFCGLFNFDQNRCIRTLPTWPFCWLTFLVDFLKCWKYPSNSSETFKMLFFYQNNQFEAKAACFADFSILTKIAVSGPYRRGHFVSWFFEILKIPFQFFWNIHETLLFHQKNQFEAKTACFADFSILTKIAVSRPYRRGHFVGWFFWLIFWNVENTLPILLKHSKCCSFIKTISLKQKQHVLRTLKFWPKSLYPDLTGVAIFFGWFFEMLKIPFQFFWNIHEILFFHENNQFEGKTACFADFSILTKIAVSGPYRRGHFVLLVDFFDWFFEMLKIPFQFFWNIQNVVLLSKQSVWSKSSMFCGLFNFDQNRCIRTLPAWPFCWLIFLVDFLKCSKYPSNSSETFMKHVILLSKKSVWSKNSMFCGLFNFDQNRCIRTLPAWPFCWLIFWLIFWNVENTLPILLKHSCKHVIHSWKQSVWSKNSMFCGLFNFDQNRCIQTLPAWPFCFVGWFFWLIFWNVENTLPILLKHSKFSSFMKTISLKQKQYVLGTFQFWPKSLYPDLTDVAILLLIFLVDFLKCWKYPSNSSETFKMLFFYQNNQFEAKAACFADFSILTKIAVSGPYRRGHFVSWFFWLIFRNVENTLPILLKHSKFCYFIKTISLKEKQHVLRTFQFWPKSLHPDLTGVAILLVDFFG